MVPSAYDPCLMFTSQIYADDRKERPVVCLLTNDNLCAEKDAFKDREERLSRRFASKPA